MSNIKESRLGTAIPKAAEKISLLNCNTKKGKSQMEKISCLFAFLSLILFFYLIYLGSQYAKTLAENSRLKKESKKMALEIAALRNKLYKAKFTIPEI